MGHRRFRAAVEDRGGDIQRGLPCKIEAVGFNMFFEDSKQIENAKIEGGR